ncbi:histone H5-like [Varanus komodoensis]|uniref:histone H5-like n=1 Tax=Varanus komodoensis TaxID=61221 RepID=UPI001CF7A538|nr:histone H5-like [Varanus komodoensis]
MLPGAGLRRQLSASQPREQRSGSARTSVPRRPRSRRAASARPQRASVAARQGRGAGASPGARRARGPALLGSRRKQPGPGGFRKSEGSVTCAKGQRRPPPAAAAALPADTTKPSGRTNAPRRGERTKRPQTLRAGAGGAPRRGKAKRSAPRGSPLPARLAKA